MTLGRGSVTNGAYSYSAAGVSTACHNYYFQFTSSSLAIVRYPDTGTLGFGNSGCSDWQNTAAPPPVTNIVATATSSTTVQVTWSGSCATLCRVYRSRFNDKSTFDLAGTGVSPFTDVTASAGRAYLYKVRAFNGTESVDSNLDLANTTMYTNTMMAGSIIQAVDINQMRDAVDAVRTLAGMTAGAYTWGSGSPSRIALGTMIHAADILELRANLDAAWFSLFSVHLSFTNTITAGSSVVQAIDFNEIRGGMQ
jgi:fibronectin type 3 domain-containing protein